MSDNNRRPARWRLVGAIDEWAHGHRFDKQVWWTWPLRWLCDYREMNYWGNREGPHGY